MNSNISNGLNEQRWGPSEFVAHPKGGRLWLRHPASDDFPLLHRLLISEISPQACSEDAMRAVFAHNPDSLWVILHQETDGHEARIVGFEGFLPLNKSGFAALKSRTFDGRNPDMRCIARYGEAPAALYLWGILARGIGNAVATLIARAMGPLYKDAPIYALVTTEGGRKSGIAGGFTGTGGTTDVQIGQLIELPAYTSRFPSPRPESSVRTCVASNAVQLQQVFAIRAAVYMSEQNCPYEEEFDGNDYCATHVLGYADDKPCAAARVRYFANFAKLERLAVLKQYRGTHVARATVEQAYEICRRKGYTRVYGHSQARLLDFWMKFGFRPTKRNAHLTYSDHEYVEVVAELTPHDSPITIESDPYLIIRPEGDWDTPGVLETSGARPATNPH